jgi:hypothetical protein
MYLTLCGSSNTSTTDGLNNDSVAVVGQMAEAMMLVLAAGNLTAAVTGGRALRRLRHCASMLIRKAVVTAIMRVCDFAGML